MHSFINIHENLISDTSYRPCGCQATTLDDLITQALAGSDESLTAGFDADELCKHAQAYEFLLEYGVKYGSRFEFAGVKFTVLADNTITTEQE